MKFGSLFSGIGGFDLGFERAGMQCVWQCEIDKKASDVLKKYWKHIPNLGDVRNVRKETVEPVDLICGGFPCQDVSIAGKRKGLAGERSGLWFEFARVIDELEPKWVVIENVPGLLSSNGGRDFATIIQWLAKRGYGVAWRVLDAQYFGVPQRRRRVFIIGSFGSSCSSKVLFEQESLRRYTETRKKAQEKTTRVAGTLAASGAGLNRPRGNANEVDFLVPFSTRSFGAYAEGLGTLRASGADAGGGSEILLVFGNGNSQQIDVTSCLTTNVRMDFDSETFVVDNEIKGVRRLTPVECERLQGFPDGWTENQPDTTRYKQLGNAVAVPVAYWIGKRIVEVDKGE